jgi:hypothetical protein
MIDAATGREWERKQAFGPDCKRGNLFSFSFSKTHFKRHLQLILNSFKLLTKNQSIQKNKCSSMGAPICFLPYI